MVDIILFDAGVVCWLLAARLSVLNSGYGRILQVLTTYGSFIFLAAFIYGFWVFEWWVPIIGFVITFIPAYFFLNRIEDRGMGITIGTPLSVVSFILLGLSLLP